MFFTTPHFVNFSFPGGMMMGEVQQHQQQPGHVSLSVLIDMIVQRTYHELTILAELLPRKTDMERKIEIFNFASRTRMLFIRLNALVKWASSASKVIVLFFVVS
jgi:mediator of RNA polymerase II transcription subunit 14